MSEKESKDGKRRVDNDEILESKKLKSDPLDLIICVKDPLDLIICAIRALKSHSGSSTRAIQKYLENEFQFQDSSAIKVALKKGVESKVLSKIKASFIVCGDPIYPDLSDKVDFKDVAIGSGTRTVQKGDRISISYKGTLQSDGSVFDEGKLEFQVDGGEVVKGFDHSVLGMKKGGHRISKIPSSLGYGKRGSMPEIPPNSDLTFDIVLLAFL